MRWKIDDSPPPCFSTWHRRRWVRTQWRVDPGNIHADNRLHFFKTFFFVFLTKTIWQTKFTLENVFGSAYFMNNRVIFLLVRLNNGITRLLAGFSASVGAFGAVMKTIFFFCFVLFFSSSSKKYIPGRFSNSRRAKSDKRRSEWVICIVIHQTRRRERSSYGRPAYLGFIHNGGSVSEPLILHHANGA